MSRYGPAVLPQGGTDWGQVLATAFSAHRGSRDRALAAQRQAQADAQANELHEARMRSIRQEEARGTAADHAAGIRTAPPTNELATALGRLGGMANDPVGPIGPAAQFSAGGTELQPSDWNGSLAKGIEQMRTNPYLGDGRYLHAAETPEARSRALAEQQNRAAFEALRRFDPESFPEYVPGTDYGKLAPEGYKGVTQGRQIRQRGEEERTTEGIRQTGRVQIAGINNSAAMDRTRFTQGAITAREASGGGGVNWQTVQTDDGFVQVNPRTGETRPVSAGAGQQLQPRQNVPAAVRQKIADNQRQAASLDRALELLEQHPKGVGMARGRIDSWDQRRDPAGVELRATIADIGSLIINQRSGAAVTAAEFPRLAPFIPSPSDTPATVRTKLLRMRQVIEEESSALEAASSSGRPTQSQQPSYSPENPFAPR